jgi:uncharacterized lipoprotein YbaY
MNRQAYVQLAWGKLIRSAFVLVLLVASAACMPLTPPAPGANVTEVATEAATEEVTEEATEEATEESMEEATASPDEEDRVGVELSGVLTGSVTYLQRVALPAGSVIEVQLQDVSRQDVAATVVATQTITTAGENVPIPFELSYDPVQIDPRMTYAVSVRITVDGALRWINTTSHPVLTRGAPVTNVEVLVEPV